MGDMRGQSMTGQKTSRGFQRTSQLLQGRIRRASESRGFAQSRLLTRWAEIAGEEVASIAHPVEVSYGRQGFGATLTLLTTGAQAPMLEMQKEQLREKVNAVYGYSAISRIRITQTAPTGFADGQVAFAGKAKEPPRAPGPEAKARAGTLVGQVHDSDLKRALDALGANILSKRKH